MPPGREPSGGAHGGMEPQVMLGSALRGRWVTGGQAHGDRGPACGLGGGALGRGTSGGGGGGEAGVRREQRA